MIRKGHERKSWLLKNRSREHQNDLMVQHRARVQQDLDVTGITTSKFDATSYERQMGQVLMFGEIETIIKKLNPSLKCVRTKADKAGVFAPMGDGTFREICPFEWPMSPEWSLMQVGTEEVPVGDLPEVVTEIDQLQMEEIPTAGRELIRGWRTLFARLILSGWISLERFERSLPPSAIPRKSWADTLKKGLQLAKGDKQ